MQQNHCLIIPTTKKAINYSLNSNLHDGMEFEKKQYLKTINDPLRIEKLKEFKK